MTSKIFLNIAKNFRRFRKETSGAVSVEWVVLTSAIAGLGMAAAASVFTGSGSVAEASSTQLTETVDAVAGDQA